MVTINKKENETRILLEYGVSKKITLRPNGSPYIQLDGKTISLTRKILDLQDGSMIDLSNYTSTRSNKNNESTTKHASTRSSSSKSIKLADYIEDEQTKIDYLQTLKLVDNLKTQYEIKKAKMNKLSEHIAKAKTKLEELSKVAQVAYDKHIQEQKELQAKQDKQDKLAKLEALARELGIKIIQ